MRLNFIAFLLIVTLSGAWTTAQAQSITISVQKAPLKEVLKEIGKQSGYKVMYNNKHIENARPVTISIKHSNLKEALDQCLEGQPLSYEIISKSIIIKPKPEASKEKPAGTLKSRISGRVTDEQGIPLSGVTVKVKGTEGRTFSDKSGGFVIETENDNVVLIFSIVGYETREQSSKGMSFLAISMKEAVALLDQVQVIAYGTTTRRLSTSAITTINARDIENQPVSNPLAALQGRVPGMVITQTSGVPGSSFNIQIRGRSSLDLSLSQNNPLFIIDGIPFEPGNAVASQVPSAANNPRNATIGGLSPLNTIAPGDIESIDILKDADATSIYGSRGANGVVIITTKKGKTGATNFNINVYSGISRVGNSMQMLNTQQYIDMRKEAFKNDGLVPSADAGDPGYAPDLKLWDTTRYTNFKKLLIGNTAHATNVQASVSGGSELTQFRVGTNYHQETTVYPGPFSDKVASVNVNLNHSTANRRFNLQLSAMYANDRNQLPAYDLTRYINLPPNLQLYTPSGKLSWEESGVAYNTLGDITNPLAILEQKYMSTNENLSSNLNLSYVLLDGLKIKANFGFNSFRSDESALRPSTSLDPNGGTLPSSSFANASNKSWIIEPQIEYNLATTKGKLNVIIGNTLQDKSGKRNSMEGTNYNSDLLLSSIAAAGNIRAANDETKYRYTAIFGRINYNLEDTYIINISARRDGSSRFGPKRQWANFGAVGLAWLFTKENFFKNAFPFFSSGKLRTSYGTTGNDQIGDYKFLNLWSNTAQPYNGLPGLFPTSLYNPDYNWEINKKFEAALELGAWKDDILFSASYYNNRCSNQLIRYILPGQTGFPSVVKNFPGLVQNTGIELTLTTRNIHRKDMNWSTSFNMTIPKNRLVSFPGLSTSSYKDRYVEGKSLSIIRGFNYLGVDPQSGLYTFEDVNKDGVIYDGDYQFFGNTDPKFFGGLQNNISYKNFDLSFFFQFTKQLGLNYLAQLSSTAPGSLINQPTLVLDRWQKPGDQAEVQRLAATFDGPAPTAIAALAQSNGIYTDASFIKLKNVSVSYRLPSSLLNRLHIGACRLYVEMQNLLTITSYKGADPENQNFIMLPPLKTIVAGVQLNF